MPPTSDADANGRRSRRARPENETPFGLRRRRFRRIGRPEEKAIYNGLEAVTGGPVSVCGRN